MKHRWINKHWQAGVAHKTCADCGMQYSYSRAHPNARIDIEFRNAHGELVSRFRTPPCSIQHDMPAR